MLTNAGEEPWCGNLVCIVGSATGRVSIHGTANASGDISNEFVNDLPAVKIGAPFREYFYFKLPCMLLQVVKRQAFRKWVLVHLLLYQ
ncbi:phosphoribosylformylglycinamidine synthase II [Flammeovirgaceae bacterium 311]|nr:phosphoribosylformylglycinamidine synthase II [Flammeovirgaceae bacterium 311]